MVGEEIRVLGCRDLSWNSPDDVPTLLCAPTLDAKGVPLMRLVGGELLAWALRHERIRNTNNSGVEVGNEEHIKRDGHEDNACDAL